MNVESLKKIVEAAILASEQPLPIEHIQNLFGLDEQQPKRQDILDVIEAITQDTADKGYELKKVSSGLSLSSSRRGVYVDS